MWKAIGVAVLATACHKMNSDDSHPSDAGVYVQPRLTWVGSGGSVMYGAGGFPTTIMAEYRWITLVFNGTRLEEVIARFTGFELDHTVTMTPHYADDLLVGMSSSCTGACAGGPTREDTFTYAANGSLSTWTTVGFGAQNRAYTYDAAGRVIAIDDASGRNTIVYSTNTGCPSSVMEDGNLFTVTYQLGRLATAWGSPVEYNEDGYIVRFDGTGSLFRDLLYEPGEARGVDLWPGHFNGGFRYGFPPRGELFRLDGTCDPTLSSQATITTLAIASSGA